MAYLYFIMPFKLERGHTIISESLLRRKRNLRNMLKRSIAKAIVTVGFYRYKDRKD